MRSRNWTVLAVMGVVALALIGLLTSKVTEAQQGTAQTRIIQLGDPQGSPNATVTIVNYNDIFTEEIQFTVQGLNRVTGDFVYGLYITSATSADAYVPANKFKRILFNVDHNGTAHIFIPGLFGLNVFESPSITAIVVLEQDDGIRLGEAGDPSIRIIEGTDTI